MKLSPCSRLYKHVLFAWIAGTAPLTAADWYLRASQAPGENWHTLSTWWSAPAGSGVNPGSINASDTYYTNGFSVRTPETTTASIFGGGSLVLNGGSLLQKCKTTTQPTTLPTLVSQGGTGRTISNASTGIQIVNIGSLSVTDSETTAFNTGGSAKGFNLTLGTLKGSGDLDMEGAGNILLSLTSGSQFHGTIYVTGNTTLTAQTALATSGALVVEAGSKVILNQNITVTALIVGGTTTQPAGLPGLKRSGAALASNTTYTFAQLNAAYPAIFPSGSGSITVTQPKIAVNAAQVVNTVKLGQLGVNLGAGKFWTSVLPNYRRDMEQLKIGLVRTPTYPSKGYSLQDMDIRVSQILNAGGTPFFVQGITKPAPPFTTEQQSFHDALLDLNGNTGTGGTVATNTAFLVQRYKSPPYNLTTQVWEVGNEPDISIDYQVASPQEYITYYQSVHNQLVASGLRENVKLCGPVVAFEYGFAANGNRTDNILNAFFEQCGPPLNGHNQVDILTRHVYANIYDWETNTPKTTDSAYNLLNAPCEQVTFTQAHIPQWSYRGEAAIQSKLRQYGFPSTVGTGITEFNVPSIYRHTITQGLWFLTYNHFALYNPRSLLSNGFVFDSTSNPLGYYKGDKTPSYGYWATYIHNLLTGDEVLEQNCSDPHLLVTATRDDTYVYLQIVNRNDSDITASVNIANAPVSAGTTAAHYELTATGTPDIETATSFGTNFTYTFPAMSARVFRYLRSDAPAPVTPPAPPTAVVLDTSFDAAPAGLQTYYTAFQPVVTGGNLKLTNTTANMTAAAILNGNALPASRKRMQARFGYRIDSGHAGTGFVFAAYSANPGAAGGAAAGLGFYGQPNVLWGVKIQNKGAEPDQIGIVPNSASSKVDGWVSQPLPAYPTGYAMDMYVIVDYDGDAGTVRARLYQGTSEAGTLFADLTNRLGNPAALPAGTVFGFTASTTSFSEITLIQNLKITADNGTSNPPGTLPSPWVFQDVGTFTPAGSATHSSGVYTLTTGNGLTLMAALTADGFTYVYQPANGDCSITARVASLTCGDTIKGEAGVMIRESLATNSAFALSGITTGRGIQFSYRASTAGTTASTAGTMSVAPQWVRVTRAGNVFTAYRSADNVTWTQVGTPQTIPMTSSVYIGLALCNHGGTGTSNVESVTVTP